MMNVVWAAMCFVGLVWGVLSGRSGALSEAALNAVMDAVQLSIRLMGGFALWSGMLCIVERSGAIRALTRALSPILRRLFPDVGEEDPAREAMAMNMAANMLGLGNAATPMGLRAMRLLAQARETAVSRGDLRDQHCQGDAATDAMCMFLVINASSLQLFPSTVVTMRAAAGSAAPASIVLPALLSTGISTVVGVAACALLARLARRRHG